MEERTVMVLFWWSFFVQRYVSIELKSAIMCSGIDAFCIVAVLAAIIALYMLIADAIVDTILIEQHT